MTGKAGELKTIKNGIPGTCLSSSTTVYIHQIHARKTVLFSKQTWRERMCGRMTQQKSLTANMQHNTGTINMTTYKQKYCSLVLLGEGSWSDSRNSPVCFLNVILVWQHECSRWVENKEHTVLGTCLSSRTIHWPYTILPCQETISTFETGMKGKDVWKDDTAKSLRKKHNTETINKDYC